MATLAFRSRHAMRLAIISLALLQEHVGGYVGTGQGMRDHTPELKDDMRKLLADDDDDFNLRFPDTATAVSAGGFLQTRTQNKNANELSLDDYIKDSENALSAALGPRWDAKTLEDDANTRTKALLHGISSRNGLGGLLAGL